MTKDNKSSQEICRERTGQYGHGFEAMCQCGRTKGKHLAERPWSQDDTSDGFPVCEGFKKAKKRLSYCCKDCGVTFTGRASNSNDVNGPSCPTVGCHGVAVEKEPTRK